MVERRPWLNLLSHAVLLLGVAVVAFPVYLTFVAASHTAQAIVQAPMPLLPVPYRARARCVVDYGRPVFCYCGT